jgi:hypothetical protein
MRHIEYFNLFSILEKSPDEPIRIDINKPESFYKVKYNIEDEASYFYKTLLDFKNYISESSTEALALPLGDGDKDKIQTALWDKLANTPELKSYYDLTGNKSDFFKPANFKNHNILDDVKLNITKDNHIILTIANLGKKHTVEVKLGKALNSADINLTATFNLGNIFGYK